MASEHVKMSATHESGRAVPWLAEMESIRIEFGHGDKYVKTAFQDLPHEVFCILVFKPEHVVRPAAGHCVGDGAAVRLVSGLNSQLALRHDRGRDQPPPGVE